MVYNKPFEGSLLNSQDSMESKARFFFVAQFSHRKTRSCAGRLMNGDPGPSPNFFYLTNSSIVEVESKLSIFDMLIRYIYI